jgi:uronate dehydrogenase
MRVLITGAAGQIGRTLRAGLAGRYEHLSLLDIAPQEPAGQGETCITADIGDLAAMTHAMQGIDCVVHLAGMPIEPEENVWEQVLSGNIVGSYHVFEAARIAGVKRMVYASSHHAIGFYRREVTIAASVAPRPDSYYGASKVFSEALGRLYADKFGMSVVCLRIGAFRPKPSDERHLSVWLIPGDMVELARCCIDAPAFHYCTVYGISANTRAFWDNREAAVLGYAPRDNAEDFAAEILASGEPEKEVAKPFHGGWYCAMGFSANVDEVD